MRYTLKHNRSGMLFRRQWIHRARIVRDQILTQDKSTDTEVIVTQVLDQNRKNAYTFDKSDKGTLRNVSIDDKKKAPMLQLATLAQNTTGDLVTYFLPQGYPSSVRNGYATFVKGQMISNTLSSAGGVLSMQALLYAMGLGSTGGGDGVSTLPLAATLNWVIKDGLGQLGGVLFASMVSNNFDADPKRWRMKAALSMDSASFLELLAPLAPGYFLLIASVANIGKNISFLAASASRAAIHKSFALQENLADITAKTGSQSIVSSLVGTSLGISIAAAVGEQYHYTVLSYCACSTISMAITYYSLTHVTITSLSHKRLEYILHQYCNFSHLPTTNGTSAGSGTGSETNTNKTTHVSDPVEDGLLKVLSNELSAHAWMANRPLLTPEDLRQRETLLGVPTINAAHSTTTLQVHGISIGSNLHDIVKTQSEFETLSEIFEKENFLLHARKSSDTPESSGLIVHLLFKEAASQEDVLKGTICAYLVKNILASKNSPYACDPSLDMNILAILRDIQQKIISDVKSETIDGMVASSSTGASLSIASQLTQQLLTPATSEWKVSESLLESRRARLQI